MDTLDVTVPVRGRAGGWLPRDHEHVERWVARLREIVAGDHRDLVEPIAELRDMVQADHVLRAQIDAMFEEALAHKKRTPLGEVGVRTFDEFLKLLNGIMTTAPESYQDVRTHEASGLIGFPVNALLDWPMGTKPGYDVFANSLVNQQLKKILAYWARFLSSPESRYVLTEPESRLDRKVEIVPWLGEQATSEMVKMAKSALGQGPDPTPDTFEEIFDCDPSDEYYGFASWDDFFTRTFRPGVRPLPDEDDDVVVNACESAPLQVCTGVPLSAGFWLKGQYYSLENMLDFDDYTPEFDGGTVYQAFLSALSYHRWHSPVNGVVTKARVVNGSYYLENLDQGFASPQPDPSAPNDSQPFLTAVATRALIFIEADNPEIGLLCVMPVGMSEVSSCEITVTSGQRVAKGEQLGMFHFGGSTHCLIFRPGVALDFDFYGQQPNIDATNLRLGTPIARLR